MLAQDLQILLSANSLGYVPTVCRLCSCCTFALACFKALVLGSVGRAVGYSVRCWVPSLKGSHAAAMLTGRTVGHQHLEKGANHQGFLAAVQTHGSRGTLEPPSNRQHHLWDPWPRPMSTEPPPVSDAQDWTKTSKVQMLRWVPTQGQSAQEAFRGLRVQDHPIQVPRPPVSCCTPPSSLHPPPSAASHAISRPLPMGPAPTWRLPNPDSARNENWGLEEKLVHATELPRMWFTRRGGVTEP